ncbi:MAG: hypothetical protein AB1592_11395 [Pseudomonadota bacterium]
MREAALSELEKRRATPESQMSDDPLELYADDVEIIDDNGVTRFVFSVGVLGADSDGNVTEVQRVVSRIALDREAAKVLQKQLAIILP